MATTVLVSVGAGLLAPSAEAASTVDLGNSTHSKRYSERLDRGLVAVPSEDGTFVSWRLLSGENSSDVAFNVYKGSRRLNDEPLTDATSYEDDSDGAGVYTVRVVRDGVEESSSDEALTFDGGSLDIHLLDAEGYYVHHAWPGDLDGDGRYEIVLTRVPEDTAATSPSYLEAYTLDGSSLWRIDLGPGSYTRAAGNAANDPAPGAVSGWGAVAGYRNDDGVTVYDLDSDGVSEVVIRTSPGVEFPDGRVLAGSDATDQFVTVVDGLSGQERVSVPVPDDFLDQGVYGAQFGVAYLDGVHPSLITKLTVREGAKRGSFDAVVSAWDFDGLTLSERWRFLNEAQSQGAWFHQIRIVDLDGDGKDEFADGSYVVDDDGTLLYAVDGAGHGDRFDIGDFDPERAGLEGYAIQQTEVGVWSAFPWYYYDAATGERLVTGQHPTGEQAEAAYDVGRGLAADIDPDNVGYEYWGSVSDASLPAAGVWSVSGQRLTTTTPSVNFRIWWDGDTGSELLDSTSVQKWDPDTETSTTINDPEGVVSGPRSAVPLYGDLLGDWREEYVAETTDGTALRVYTTTVPTDTRLVTLAQDPEYRLGWTVRGYLQALYTSYYLGYGTTSSPTPAIRYTGTTQTYKTTELAADTFTKGTKRWVSELEQGGAVTAEDGTLDIDVPGGATVWWKKELEGPYVVELTVTAVSAGGTNDRVSDLNVFWGARDPDTPEDIFDSVRTGAFADYDLLETYYVGFGGNSNTTTRFRRYIGVAGDRPLLGDLTEPLLEANHAYRLKIVNDAETIQYWVDGHLLFSYHDTDAYNDGWFAIRTTGSHLSVQDFSVRTPNLRPKG